MVHCDDDAPEQVAQLEAQLTHVDPLENVDEGQPATQVLLAV